MIAIIIIVITVILLASITINLNFPHMRPASKQQHARPTSRRQQLPGDPVSNQASRSKQKQAGSRDGKPGPVISKPSP